MGFDSLMRRRFPAFIMEKNTGKKPLRASDESMAYRHGAYPQGFTAPK
jgi:hypothetical protein